MILTVNNGKKLMDLTGDTTLMLSKNLHYHKHSKTWRNSCRKMHYLSIIRKIVVNWIPKIASQWESNTRGQTRPHFQEQGSLIWLISWAVVTMQLTCAFVFRIPVTPGKQKAGFLMMKLILSQLLSALCKQQGCSYTCAAHLCNLISLFYYYLDRTYV